MTDEPGIILASPMVQMAFACENISQDPQGRVSFQNIVDSLSAPIYPATTPMLYVIFGFHSPSGSGLFLTPLVEIIGRTGNVIASQKMPHDVKFSPSSPMARIITGLNGVTWPQPDDYVVKFTSNGKVKASFPLKLHLPQSQ